MTINIDLPQNGYDIIIERGILKRAKEELNLERKVLIVTDSGVPSVYAETLAAQCQDAFITVIDSGEKSKNFDNFLLLQKNMLENGFSRKDCVVAIGGGVAGDLSGFAAGCFMRGIDFYNIPTTVLSEVDSSVGGKTAVDFMGVKNVIGLFYQPKKLLIDPDTLKTLPARQIANGLIEAIKMAATFDEEYFKMFEEAKGFDDLDLEKVIEGAVRLKADVVIKDEKEAGLRKVLNFGHTLGHGIEASTADTHLKDIVPETVYKEDYKTKGLLHGESVAIGMLAMCDDEVKERIGAILDKLNVPKTAFFDEEKAMDAIMHDKKLNKNVISTVYVKKIGSFEMRDMDRDELRDRLDTLLRKKD